MRETKFSSLISSQDSEESEYQIGIINLDRPDKIEQMFKERYVENSNLEYIQEPERWISNDEEYKNTVGLFKDGKLIETTPLGQLEKYSLLIDTGPYSDGTLEVDEVEYPSVLKELENMTFTIHTDEEEARGKEKLILVVLSRFIEYNALSSDGGTIRTAFQTLDRMQDEYGTKRVYKRLSRKDDLDTHLYGLPYYDPSRTLDVKTHTGDSDEYKYSWFVVFEPESNEDDPMALLFNKKDEYLWKGFWTRDPTTVAAVEDKIKSIMR